MNKYSTNLTRLGRTVFAAAVATGVAACERSTFHVSQPLGETSVLLSSAELSKTFERPGTFDPVNGRFQPNSVVCAEPSPDVVKAVQSSFGISVGAAAQGTGSASAAASQAIAESAAQLGERLATIQLLRDGLYRACEAFGNGAFSEVTYAVLLSRYDDTMVTLMTAELAAGAFGRSGAALGGEAAGKAAADSSLRQVQSELIEKHRELEQSREEKEDVETSLTTKRAESRELESKLTEAKTLEGNAQAELDTVAPGTPASEVQKLEQKRDEAHKDVTMLSEELAETNKQVRSLSEKSKELEKSVENRKKELEIKTKAETEASAKATAVASGGITPGQQNPEIAATLATMQRKFLENINSDALVVACVTALARDKGLERSALSRLCDGPVGLLRTIVNNQSIMLAAVKSRSIIDRDRRALEDAVAEIGLINKSLNQLRTDTKPSSD